MYFFIIIGSYAKSALTRFHLAEMDDSVGSLNDEVNLRASLRLLFVCRVKPCGFVKVYLKFSNSKSKNTTSN